MVLMNDWVGLIDTSCVHASTTVVIVHHHHSFSSPSIPRHLQQLIVISLDLHIHVMVLINDGWICLLPTAVIINHHHTFPPSIPCRLHQQ